MSRAIFAFNFNPNCSKCLCASSYFSEGLKLLFTPQTFINILFNAEQSIPQKGEIKIKAETSSDKGKQFIRVHFQDNGSGIGQDSLSKIFDPFFSTKEPGEGVGLGLSMSYGIIKANQGDIEIKSQEHKGTEVIVTLPI